MLINREFDYITYQMEFGIDDEHSALTTNTRSISLAPIHFRPTL